MRSRSDCVVSPVRTRARISTSGNPCACIMSRMPCSGPCRFFCISLDRAFRGETYRIYVSSASPPASASRTRSSIAARNAARVLPLPVGAAIRV